YLGLLIVLALNQILASSAYLAILVSTGGEVHFTLASALWLSFVQAALLGALAVLFSSFSTASLAVMFVVGLYLIGTNLSQIREVASRMDISPLRTFLE